MKPVRRPAHAQGTRAEVRHDGSFVSFLWWGFLTGLVPAVVVVRLQLEALVVVVEVDRVALGSAAFLPRPYIAPATSCLSDSSTRPRIATTSSAGRPRKSS